MRTKKILLGLGILIVFGGYTRYMRGHAPVLSKPAALTTTGTHTGSTGSSSSTAPTTGSTASTVYKDGSYTGSVANAYYGNVQVAVTISGGKVTNVTFLQHPDTHETSVIINQQAMPYLQQEAIQAQSSNVQVISGATFTSQAFQQSLQSALSQAS